MPEDSMRTEPASPLDRIVTAGAMVVLAVSANQFSVELAPKAYVSVADPLVWSVFLLWLVQAFRRRTLRAVLRVPLFAALFLAICALSCLRATSLLSAFKDMFQFVEYFLVAFLVFSTTLSLPGRRRAMVLVFLAVTGVIVVVAAAQYMRAEVDDFMVRGLFGNRNVLGGFLSLAIPLLFAFLLHDNVWWRKALSLAILGTAAMVLLSAAAFIAISVSCLLLAAWKGRVALLVTAAALVLLGAVILPRTPRANTDVHYQSVACFTDEGEVKGRYPEWHAAAIMAMENPWLGVGVGNYQANIGMYYGMLPSPNETTEPDSQNLYLVLASSTGIAGAIAFSGLLATAILAALRQASLCRSGPDAALSAGAAASIAAFAITAFWSPLLVRGIGIPLAFLLALATHKSERVASAVAPTPTA